VIGPVRHTVPRALRRVRRIDVDLGIDNRHRGSSSMLSGFPRARRTLGTPLRVCALRRSVA
jgi:hypothetical protein